YAPRYVLVTNKADTARLKLSDGDAVTLTTKRDDQVRREIRDLRATAYNVPVGCCADYYPECNPLIPWWHHAEGSKTPAAKSIPVRVQKSNGLQQPAERALHPKPDVSDFERLAQLSLIASKQKALQA